MLFLWIACRSFFYLYASPPFCLVSKCVQKIVQDQASGVLVLPLWPTQPYFMSVLNIFTDTPRIVKAISQSLVHPSRNSPHSLHQRLDLLLYRLSGIPCLNARFHQTLPMSSCSLGELVHKNNTKSTSIQFCLQRPQDPQPTVTAVLDFLHSLFKQVLSYSALNTAGSAISNVDMQNNNVQGHTPVGRHMLVCRYLNMRKPTPKYSNFWSVDIVLDYLSSLWPLDQLTLKQLTVELIILIALTTGRRCQTLAFLDVSHDCMEKTENCYNFGLTNHIKQDKPDKLFGTLSLHKYPVKPIGVYETLTFYLESTEKCRKSTSVL